MRGVSHSGFRPVFGRSLAGIVALAALCTGLAGCKNPLYWVWPARKLFVSVTSARKIFELDRAGPRSTWAQIWLDSGPTRLEVARERGSLFALLPEARAVAEVSPHTYQVIGTLSTQGRSTDLAISADNLWAYALNPDERTVVRLDLERQRVERTLSYADAGAAPVAIGTHPTRADELYVVTASGSVSVVIGGLKGSSFSIGAVGKPSRVVPGPRGELYVVDGAGTNLYRITDAPGSATPRVEAFGLALLGGSCVAGADGTIYATAPGANKLVRLGTDQSRAPFDVGGQTPRAVVADEAGVYVANEGSNQVVKMEIKGGKLYEPVVVDTLPGPPVDLAIFGD